MLDNAKSVYIAGPYTRPDPAINVARSMAVFHALKELGYAPFLPHAAHFIHMHKPLEYDVWLEWDFHWLARCDVMIRMPGESSGADKEDSFARDHGIPVFYDIPELASSFAPQPAKSLLEIPTLEQVLSPYPFVDQA